MNCRMCRFMVDDLDIVGVDTAEGKDFAVLHHIEYKNGEIGCNYIISNVKCYERKEDKEDDEG